MSKKQYVFLVVTLFILLAINIVGICSFTQKDKNNNTKGDLINIKKDQDIQKKFAFEDMIALKDGNTMEELSYSDITEEYKDFSLYRKNGKEIVANCKKSYRPDDNVYEGKYCDIKISDASDNVWNLKIVNNFVGCTASNSLYVHNDYLIVIETGYCVQGMELKIYTFDGKLVYETKNGYVGFSYNNKSYTFYPFIRDNKLYYIEVSHDFCQNMEKPVVTYFKSLSLDGTNKLETLFEFDAEVGLNC